MMKLTVIRLNQLILQNNTTKFSRMFFFIFQFQNQLSNFLKKFAYIRVIFKSFFNKWVFYPYTKFILYNIMFYYTKEHWTGFVKLLELCLFPLIYNEKFVILKQKDLGNICKFRSPLSMLKNTRFFSCAIFCQLGYPKQLLSTELPFYNHL